MPTTRRKKKTRPGKMITFKLYLDEDREVIQWLESLSRGQRSELLRELVRTHAGAHDLVGLLTGQHRETQRKLDELLTRLAQGLPIGQPVPAATLLDTAAAQRRKHNLLKTEW